MSIDSPSDSSAITIRGYVTDAKRVGYQVLTNYESIYWRALVGNNAWSLYEVLRSFCHNGNNTRTPSIQFLTTILGLEDKRALIGRSKTVKGKEYRYPGLIEVLQEYKLVIAEVQGEAPRTWYVFHVNLTPDLLTPEQVGQLPIMLQKKHADLLKRSLQAQHELEAKRKPSRFENSNKNRSDASTEGGGNFPCPVGNSHRGGGKFPPKQYPNNNTQKTQSIYEDDHNNSSASDDEQSVVVALLQAGIAEKVAKRLAQRYNKARIEEKISYLAFLLTEQPDKVQNPRGWLRRAIEEDYGQPDGFVTAEDRTRRELEAAEQARRAEATEQSHRAFAAQLQAKQEARRRELQERYHTTEADYQLWSEVLTLFKSSRPDLHDVYARAQILRCTDEVALLGFEHQSAMQQLAHPGTLQALKRQLKLIANRPLAVETILLSVASTDDPGEDRAGA